MTRNAVVKAVLCGTLIALAAFFVLHSSAQAQAGPQFLITWHASGSYVPPSYSDKAFPTYGSKITASLALFSGNSFVDLRGQTIYWYLNENLIGGGVGVQTVSFPPLGTPPAILTLRVELPSYNGQLLTRQVQIPVVRPVAVIYAPYPQGRVSTNPVSVTALPYFFNTTSSDNLSFSWTVNGQPGANGENPQAAIITLPNGTSAGTVLGISLSVKNPQDSTAASANINLTYAPQL
jgi:hypothetical protein